LHTLDGDRATGFNAEMTTAIREHDANRSPERKEPVRRGTGNVFADLGFTDAAERQARLRLAYALNQALERGQLSHADAPKVLQSRPKRLASFEDIRR